MKTEQGIEADYDDAFYMRKCVELAKRAIGCTSPNPMVGCVIVKDGKIVGEGFHPKAGQPHAEVTKLHLFLEMREHSVLFVGIDCIVCLFIVKLKASKVLLSLI